MSVNTNTMQNPEIDASTLQYGRSKSDEQRAKRSRKMLASLNRELSEELCLVNEKKKQIMDSINYAHRLQSAMLPSTREINEFVKDHFILNMPKSVIGGDFYYVDSFSTKFNQKYTAIALADCTGHGVPGAMLSTLSCGILRSALANQNINSAGEVLDHLRDNIMNVFRADSPLEMIRDGMDISLCILDPKTNVLQYAGAYQKGIVIKKDRSIIELMPDKQHIGYNENNFRFNTSFIRLQEGDTIYLFSDGFKDQFGGEHGKKLQYKNFANKLIEINQYELSHQRTLLQEFFNNWKKDLSQTDDVLVVGIKI